MPHSGRFWSGSSPRFTRKRENAVAFKAMLRRKGVRVVSITEHADDTPTGKLMEAIIESVDEFYSENLAQEVTRGMRESASRGFLGFQLRPLRLQPGDGAGRGQEAPHLPYTSVETERGAGGGAFTHRVPPEWVRYQELKLSITISLALMITAMLRYSATAVAYVTAYGTPGRVDMGNVG